MAAKLAEVPGDTKVVATRKSVAGIHQNRTDFQMAHHRVPAENEIRKVLMAGSRA